MEAMRGFGDWAMRVVASKEDTDMVMPTEKGFVFSLGAWNYFASHYNKRLRHYKKEEQLEIQMRHYRKQLYTGEGAVLMKKSRFFLLPNRL
ncbi:MAG: hypothetical protein ACREBF_04810 [Candidatus Micrarchaeales archaeon]